MTDTICILITATSVALLLYVIILYPILLAWLATKGIPIQKEWKPRTVSIVIPVYNGARYLRAKLESVVRLNYPKDLIDVLVVSDGSTDDTDRIVESFKANDVRLMRVPKGGKSAALNAGIAHTKGEILMLTDARQPVDEESLRHLTCCFSDLSVGTVSGHLLIRGAHNQDEKDIGAYWRYESWIRDNLARVDSIFGATGPLFAIRRSLVVNIPPEILLDDVFLPLAGFFKGYRLVVEPKAKLFDIPTPRTVEFQRKVRTLAGNYQLLLHYPNLLGPGNRMWFHFVSYKIGRLVLPYAVLATLIFSFGLPPLWRDFMLGGQIVVYTLAVADPWIKEGRTIKRLSSPTRTFFTMMIATLYALRVFFVPPQALWKVTDVPVPTDLGSQG